MILEYKDGNPHVDSRLFNITDFRVLNQSIENSVKVNIKKLV